MDRADRIGYAILNLVISFDKVFRHTQNYGTNVPIYTAEIRVVSKIGEHPGIHIGGLAELLEISKAAVSEMLMKLEKKRLVVKKIDPQNLSRLQVYLTKRGESAHKNHMEYHRHLNETIRQILANVPEEKIQFLEDFLSSLHEKVEEFQP
jgi:DNA-binding MarR family transcriptional regulator